MTTPASPYPFATPNEWDDHTIRRLIWTAAAAVGIAVLAAIFAWPTPNLTPNTCGWDNEALIQTVNGLECRTTHMDR